MRKFVEIETTDNRKALVNVETINYACKYDDKSIFKVNTTSFIWDITKESYIKLIPYLICENETHLKKLLKQVENHFRQVDEYTRKIQEYQMKIDIINVQDRELTTAVLKKHYMFTDFLEINDIPPEEQRTMKSQTTISDENQVWEYTSQKIERMILRYKQGIALNKRWLRESEELMFDM